MASNVSSVFITMPVFGSRTMPVILIEVLLISITRTFMGGSVGPRVL